MRTLFGAVGIVNEKSNAMLPKGKIEFYGNVKGRGRNSSVSESEAGVQLVEQTR